MNILHVIYIPRHSGAEILVRALADRHAAESHLVAIASLRPAREDFASTIEQWRNSNVKLFIPDRELSTIGRLRLLRTAISHVRPDVVVAHSVIPAVYARLVSRASIDTLPVVTVLHAANEDDYQRPYAIRMLEHLLHRWTRVVVTVSQRAAENYASRFGSGVPVRVIRNGIDTQGILQRSAARQVIRERLACGNRKILVQVGRIARTKQQHLSVLATCRIARADPQIALWLVGLVEDEKYRQEIMRLVVREGMLDAVRWFGSRSDAIELMIAADVILFPSLVEAHSVAFLEALATGRPIVASNISQTREALHLAGLRVLDPSDTQAFSLAIHCALARNTTYQRDLRGLDIGATCSKYLEVFREAQT